MEKSVGEFTWHKDRGKRDTTCKECWNAWGRVQRAAKRNGEPVPTWQPQVWFTLLGEHGGEVQARRCNKCGEIKPLSEFHPRRGKAKDPCRSMCKACHAAEFQQRKQDAEWHENHLATRRARRKVRPDRMNWSEERKLLDTRRGVVRVRGITIADYDALFEEQNGVCAICGGTNNTKALAIDHDHETGYIRGLLCDCCNLGIGHFRDNIELLRNAIRYLKFPTVSIDAQTELRNMTFPIKDSHTREYHRNWELGKDYGVTLAGYKFILERQGGKCAVCGGVNSNGRPLYVDHNHETAHIRGLLCMTCNTGLSKLRESERVLFDTIAYLRLHAAQFE